MDRCGCCFSHKNKKRSYKPFAVMFRDLDGDTKGWTEYDEFRKSVTVENFAEKMDIELADMKENFTKFSDEDFSQERDFYGKAQVSEHMMNILRNFSAYRMQLFLYIKANGVNVNTMNLWGGMDSMPKN